MEQEIKQTSKQLKYLYFAFWFIAIAAVVLCEVFDEFGGKYADNDKVIYLSETILILLTIVCIPVSLKYYARILTNKIDKLGIADAIKSYRTINYLRLSLLTLPLWVGVYIYYQMLSTTGILCALIALTASLFCVPGEKRMREELFIHQEKSGEDDNEK